MKIGGNIIGLPKPKVIVIPRGENNFVFKVGPVVTWDEFEKLCPEPKIPEIVKRGETTPSPFPEDTEYQEALSQYLKNRINYVFIMSLASYTEDIEFEHIKLHDPTTWSNLNKEFESTGLSVIEINTILEGIKEVNGLSADMIEEATKNFMLQQVLKDE